MAIKGYRAKTWEPDEVVTADAMNQLSTNVQLVHDYTPRAMYGLPNGSGGRVEGVKIASGKMRVEANKKQEARKVVQFGGFFNPCNPNIATSLNTNVNRVFLTITGRGGKLQPDHTGFVINLQKDSGKINRGSLVHWVAVGI